MSILFTSRFRVRLIIILVVVFASIFLTVNTVAEPIHEVLGYKTITGTTSGYLTVGTGSGLQTISGVLPDPFGDTTWSGWTLVRVLPYIFIAIGLLIGIACLGTCNIVGLIIALVIVIASIVGLGVILTFIP